MSSPPHFPIQSSLRTARDACRGLKDLRAITDLNASQATALINLGIALKATYRAQRSEHAAILTGLTLAMVFEKPSLRTRVSFETGMHQLGGHAIYLGPADISLGKRESVADVARNLDRMVDGIMARVFAHQTIQELAANSAVPVINGLCDLEHPCQALADFLTIRERLGPVAGRRVVYVGDGNNVAHSLMLLGALLGCHMVVATPVGYEPLPAVVSATRERAEAAGGSVTTLHDPVEACRNADVIYTDVWASMGQEAEAEARRQVFAEYQVNERLTAAAQPNHLFLHCLPAHRGEEVSASVIDGPNSVVFDQAENRLHAQKAVMAVLMGGKA